VLADGEVDAAVQTPAFTTRWDNYWIEGVLWLVRNLDIDGIYLDGAPYERGVLRRLRRALEPLTREREFLIDLHASCAGNPHLPYVELYPYIDSIWFGEQCEYPTYSPEQWLAEVSGIPFGLPGQVLGTNRDQWQALVFGMTCRIYPNPYTCNPRDLWQALDSLGLGGDPQMLGWWDPRSPLRLDSQHTRATLFVHGAHFAIALASWEARETEVTISFDWAAMRELGFSVPQQVARLRAPAIAGFQPAHEWAAEGARLRVTSKGSGYDGGQDGEASESFGEGWLLGLS